MAAVNIGLSHYILLIGLITLVILLAAKKDITIPSLVLLFILSITTGDGIYGAMRSLINTLSDFAAIFIVLALTAAIACYLQSSLGTKICKPLSSLMRSPMTAMLVLSVAGFFLSLLLWSPIAVPLVAILLLPPAFKAGLKPTGAAMSLMFAGSLAMSLDSILGIVPNITAFAADCTVNTATPALLTGITAILCMILLNRRHFTTGEHVPPQPYVLRPKPINFCLYRGSQIAAALLLPIAVVCSLLNAGAGLLADWAEILTINAAMHAYPPAVIFLLMTLSALCGRGGLAGLPLAGALAMLLCGTTGIDPSLLLALVQVTAVWFTGCFSPQFVTPIQELCGNTDEAIQLSLLPILLGMTVTLIYAVIII